MREHLAAEGLLARMVASTAAEALLTSLQIQDSNRVSDAHETGTVLFGLVEKLGIFDLALIPPGPNDRRDYVLLIDGPSTARTGFRLAISLHEGPAKPLFKLLPDVAGRVLTPAKVGPDGESLIPLGGTTQLKGAGVWLVLEGRSKGAIEIKLSPKSEPPDDVITLQLDPPAALLSGGFGISFPEGICIDQADQAVPPGSTRVNGTVINTPADTPSWRGIVVRKAHFFLPREVPFLGGHAVEAHLQVGLPPTPGIDLVLTTTVPPKDGRPAIAVRIECRDPMASGLASFVPTLVEMAMDLPLDGRQETFESQNFGSQALKLAAGKPVRIRATYARKPAPPNEPESAELSLAFESQGPAGLVRIDSSDGNLGSKIAVTAATLATALIADEAPPEAGDTGIVMQRLLIAAVGLSSFLESGQVVVHSAEFVTTGGVVPAGETMQLKIDYSVAATVTGINVGVMSLQMQPNQPFRVRVREVILTIDPAKQGLEMIHLDYTKSSLEIEDPGGWKVTGPGKLFDVLGTRSGRGSMWLEVDLRFKLDLGPVKVSGVTVRGTLDDNGKMSGSLRGLEASIALAPMIDGNGVVELTKSGFFAALAAQILPLRIGARADVETADDMVKLALGVDLPGPLPLANTGLGIYGLGGVFAANGKPKPVSPGKDPVQHQLDWNYKEQGSFVPAEAFSFGLEAVIGTAVDMGFTFSARAGLFITTPEFAVRGALNGRFMGERVKITREEEGGPGIRAKGVVVVDPNDGVTIAIEGKYIIPEILEIVVPVGARFPKGSPDWYIHLGADGWAPPPGAASQGRERGPVRATVLPNLLGQVADAYLMFRGNGITNWPRGGPVTIDPGMFVAAFGFGFNIVWGLRYVVWVEVFMRADILMSTNPRTLVGLGRAGGGLHVGIFSVGVDASVHVVIMQGAPPYFSAELCGTIDLFLDEIHKCVKILFNNTPPAELPAPPHPLDAPRGQVLVDDAYRFIAPLAATREDAAVVWPDAIPLLSFVVAPELSKPALSAGQFPAAADYPEGVRARPIGGDLLQYKWELVRLSLVDSTDPANEFLVAGPLSSSWLKGKFGDAGGQPQPAELALLTPSGDLWFNALPDAGAGLPHKPLDALANICQARVSPILGWALGAGATRQDGGWHLPPHPLSTNPIQSQVRATAELHVEGNPAIAPSMLLELTSAPFLPAPFGYSPPRVRGFVPVTLDDREFSAFLDPGAVLIPPDQAERDRHPIKHELRLIGDEPISQACVWLVAKRIDWPNGDTGMSRLRVSDDLGQTWVLDQEQDLGGGYVALRWRPPATGPVEIVLARSLLAGFRVGVIALGGITATADAAAAARNAASHAEADRQRQVCANGPPKPNTPNSDNKRCTLKAGRIYRLDVEMRWSGELITKDDKGNKSVVAKRPADPSTTSTRSFWYRTAKPGGALPASGTLAYAQHLYKKNDAFDPDMLVRHLRGYEPAQSELHRFADDPVRVHFAYSHVAALAAEYGFELKCGLRRLDAPETQEPDDFPVTHLQRPTTTAYMTGPEKLIAEAYLKSPCGLCPQGAVLHAPVQLTRSAWYEVYVHADAQNGNDGRIPGVSFRTSRWSGGAEMLAALRFPVNGSGEPHGGVALTSGAVLSPKTVMDDDGAFDAILNELGMDGWPAAAEPRISLLWREMGTQWRCAGVLIESPEPIHRPGRFHVNSLQLRMGLAAPAFDVIFRDRSGSRLLFATTAPFVPRLSRIGFFQLPVPPTFRLDCTDMPIGEPAKPLTGWLSVPLRPSFSEEAA